MHVDLNRWESVSTNSAIQASFTLEYLHPIDVLGVVFLSG